MNAMKHHVESTLHSAGTEKVLPKMAVIMFCVTLIFPDSEPLDRTSPGPSGARHPSGAFSVFID